MASSYKIRWCRDQLAMPRNYRAFAYAKYMLLESSSLARVFKLSIVCLASKSSFNLENIYITRENRIPETCSTVSVSKTTENEDGLAEIKCI